MSENFDQSRQHLRSMTDIKLQLRQIRTVFLNVKNKRKVIRFFFFLKKVNRKSKMFIKIIDLNLKGFDSVENITAK